MTEPFITMDIGKLQASIRDTVKGLEAAGADAEKTFEQALHAYAEDVLSEAQARAPVGRSGELRGSGTVVPGVGAGHDGDGLVVFVGFNKVYARMRDQGGTIVPVRAKALFIPLRDGVRPGQPGLEWGVDFVLAQVVHQTGNGYLTGTFNRRKGSAAADIGKIFKVFWAEDAA